MSTENLSKFSVSQEVHLKLKNGNLVEGIIQSIDKKEDTLTVKSNDTEMTVKGDEIDFKSPELKVKTGGLGWVVLMRK
ncbi:hypothetical protein [Pseudomonas sp. RT6P73]